MKANDIYLAELVWARIYKTLTECYYSPGELTLQHVRQLGRDLKAVCPSAAEAAERMEAALLAPPYGSVDLEGERRLMGDSTLAVGECYREVGLEVAAGFNGTPDHIAAELEFMHFLVIKEIETLSGGDLVRAQHFRQKQKTFLERHLAAWTPDFARSVEAQAQTRFYQDLAASTRMFIESDFAQCRGDVPVLVSGSASA